VAEVIADSAPPTREVLLAGNTQLHAVRAALERVDSQIAIPAAQPDG
jgi:hypothetical protein